MSLPPYILNNFWLKIFSLILACLIWFAIQSNQSGFKQQFQRIVFRMQNKEIGQ